MAPVLHLLLLASVVSLGLATWTPHADLINRLLAMAQHQNGQRLGKEHHPEANMTTPEFIEHFGYPVEVHEITTPDGYNLELHRIPYGINETQGQPGRRVAYLQHCLLCSSSDWIMNDPHKALAYILADAGYDVWMGNFRGNTYSHSHISLDTDNIDYWKFSWDEMAYYDIPTTIDYILAKTGASGVYYTGWSMGTTTFFAMMSERPEYNSKVKAMAALAPIAYLDYIKGPMTELLPYSDEFDTIMTLLGVGELLPSSEWMDSLVETFCDVESVAAEVCYNFLFLLCGPDPDELNKEYLPVILSHTPAGSSIHTVNHYAQVAATGKFQKYDYGRLGNLNHYGQDTPPLYSLANVTAPVGLFWGNTDWLASPQDVAKLAAELSNVALNFNVLKPEFNHLDFGWAIHAKELVYDYVLDFFSQH